MKELFYKLVLVLSFLFITPVYATNDVDYHLTITDDNEYKEVIKYSITDYKQIEDGRNYFNSIVFDDMYIDEEYETKYSKEVNQVGDKYLVTLSYTYDEDEFANSLFLNHCFENYKFNYKNNIISYSTNDDFTCLNGDSLKITLTTNKKVTGTNAKISGNNYIWNPINANFNMNITINNRPKNTILLPIIVLSVVVVVALIIIVILRKKKNTDYSVDSFYNY